MLNPNNDRLNYRDLLSPPNYEMDFAIGTTYSLDLNSLVGISISLNSYEEFDSNISSDSIFLLDALRKTSKKVAVFCDTGQIHYPNNVTPLFILIENMVFQADINNKSFNNHYFSFHPKFWLLRFVDEDKNIMYRLIVLSRNLTFDQSWDVSFSMDGYIEEDYNAKNISICCFIEYLIQFSTDDEKTAKMKDIIKELKYVHFDLKRSIFEDYEFFINGITDDKFSIKNDSLFNNQPIDKLLVMSPFLSKNIIKYFNSFKNPNSKALLFTQLESLRKLDINDCSKFNIYTLKNEVVNNESSFDKEFQGKLNDIHAKLYLVENKRFADLYLGSLNASKNALNGNVEFMIKLRARRNNLNIKKLSQDLFCGDEDDSGNPFEKVDFDNLNFEKETKKKDLGAFVKYIPKLNPQAKINFKNGMYNIELEFDKFEKSHFDGVYVEIKPLLSKIKGCELSDKLIFKNLEKLELSEFYSIHIADLNDGNSIDKVIKVQTIGMPSDRQKDVLSKFIGSEEDFIKYIAFLLGDDYILSSIQKINVKTHDTNGNSGKILTVLYERMLKAACYSPKKFEELKFLVDNLSDKNIIPEGFVDLYNTFIEAIEQ